MLKLGLRGLLRLKQFLILEQLLICLRQIVGLRYVVCLRPVIVQLGPIFIILRFVLTLLLIFLLTRVLLFLYFVIFLLFLLFLLLLLLFAVLLVIDISKFSEFGVVMGLVVVLNLGGPFLLQLQLLLTRSPAFNFNRLSPPRGPFHSRMPSICLYVPLVMPPLSFCLPVNFNLDWPALPF